MTIEFTGERVVPDRVDLDLWNEHIARYVFAKRFCAGARVLDAGTGRRIRMRGVGGRRSTRCRIRHSSRCGSLCI